MTINMMYDYNYSSNTAIHLVEKEDGGIAILTDYNERVATVRDGRELAEVLIELANGVYDEKPRWRD